MQEAARREIKRQKDNILQDAFAEQLAFIQDKSKLKAALCTRRCLARGTLVQTSRGLVPIEIINKNDLVLDECGDFIRVTKTYVNGKLEVKELKLSNATIWASEDHYFMAKHEGVQRLVQVKEFNSTTKLLIKTQAMNHYRLQPVTVGATKIERTYDISVNSRKNLYLLANGAITHNSGKSYGIGLYLFNEALQNDATSCLYIALSRDSAKRIMWKDVIKVIDKKYHLGCKYNETTLIVTLPNNSTISLMGMDAAPSDMDKALGSKFKLIAIDEAASFTQDLNRMVYAILKPTTVDLDGTICMIGTPSNIIRGLFYDVTTGKEPGWAVHNWSAFDNPHIAENWRKELIEMKLRSPNIESTPAYQQMYLGKWYVDTSKLVYKFSKENNLYETLPNQKYHYVMGVDLGYDDDSAFVIGCYADHDPNLYIIYAYARSHMIISDVAEMIKELQEKFQCYRVVIDGANKQAVEEMRRRYQLSLTTADKTAKVDFIELMNSEFITGKIKVHSSLTNLIDEYGYLVWDERDLALGKRVEHSSCPNHMADAALYLWRYCYSYAWTKEAKVPSVYSNEWINEFENKESERLERELKENAWII